MDCFAKDFGKFSSIDFHEFWEWALLKTLKQIFLSYETIHEAAPHLSQCIKSPNSYLFPWTALGTAFLRRVQNIFNGVWWVQSWSHTSKLEHGLFQIFLSENAVVSVPNWVWFIFLTTNAYFTFSESSPCCCRVFQSPNTQQFSSKSCFTGARCVEVFSGN